MEAKLFLTHLEQFIGAIVRKEIGKQSKNQSSSSKTSNPKSIAHLDTLNKIIWLKDEHVLLSLFNLLDKYSLIACEFVNFRAHFSGNHDVFSHIVWRSSIKRLVYLFAQLRGNGFIFDDGQPHKLLAEHFLNKDGGSLINTSLKSSLDVIDSEKMLFIDKIIDKLPVS